jgi:hypothetical protein
LRWLKNKQPHMSAKLLRSNNRLHGDRFSAASQLQTGA